MVAHVPHNVCLKDDAVVWFVESDAVVHASLFRVGCTIIVRPVPDAVKNYTGAYCGKKDATHRVTGKGHGEFWRDDIGVFVVKITNVEDVHRDALRGEFLTV